MPRVRLTSWIGRRRLLGAAAVLLGVLALTAAALLASPARTVRAQSTGIVFLVITGMSDSGGGQYPAGGSATVTVSLSNSVANTGIGDATPTVTVSYSPSALSFAGNGTGWTCTAATIAGQQICTDGTISAGGSTTLPLSFSVVGNPCDPASVTATVNDAAADINSGSFSGNNTGTDSATIANASDYTKGVPSGAFPAKVGQDQILTATTSTATDTFTDGTVTVRLVVPPGSLPAGAHISIYRANAGYWQPALTSSSQSFVDGYAASWAFCDGLTNFDASSSVTMLVTDPAANPSDSLYEATTSGVGSRTGNVGAGSWAASFTSDPGFVLAAPAAATPASPVPGLPHAGRLPIGPQCGGTISVLILLGVLLVLGGSVALGIRRAGR